jgi:RNA polymerase sigma factor (sigma-70 family)
VSTGAPLTKSIEFELAERIADGDRTAAWQLVEYADGLIGQETRRYSNWHFDRDELQSVARIACVEAALKFDAAAGTFIQHARRYIAAGLVEFARVNGFSATMPADLWNNRASERTVMLARRFAEAPSVEELTAEGDDGMPSLQLAAAPTFDDDREVLLAAIDRLHSRQRSVMALVLDGFEVGEIAEALGIAVSAVSMAKKRGLESLREVLSKTF